MLLNHQEGPVHVQVIVFSDVVVHLLELHDHDSVEWQPFFAAGVEFHPPERFLNIDLSVQGKDGSSFLEPWVITVDYNFW